MQVILQYLYRKAATDLQHLCNRSTASVQYSKASQLTWRLPIRYRASLGHSAAPLQQGRNRSVEGLQQELSTLKHTFDIETSNSVCSSIGGSAPALWQGSSQSAAGLHHFTTQKWPTFIKKKKNKWPREFKFGMQQLLVILQLFFYKVSVCLQHYKTGNSFMTHRYVSPPATQL